MSARCVSNRHIMAMDDEIKFRCDTDLAQRFERIAILERRKASDLARLVFEDYINHQERDSARLKRTVRKPSAHSGAPTTKLSDCR